MLRGGSQIFIRFSKGIMNHLGREGSILGFASQMQESGDAERRSHLCFQHLLNQQKQQGHSGLQVGKG